MRRFDTNQEIQLLANVGVILGIIILAIEIRQNSSLLRAQARFSAASVAIERLSAVALDSEFADVIRKAANPEELSPTETIRMLSWIRV